MSLPIRVRLTAWHVALLSVILVAFGAFLLLRLQSDLLHAVDQSLVSRAAQISLGYHESGQGNFQDVSDAPLGMPAQDETAAQFLSPAGVVENATGDPAIAERPMIDPAAIARVASGQRILRSARLGAEGEQFRVLAVALRRPATPAVLVVASSLEEVNRSVHRLLVLIATGIPVALLAAGVGGWLLARRALRPVARMTTEAEEIGADRVGDRIAIPATADELQRLARTLNAMLDRLQEGVDIQRRFVADASHDLRTPLTVMRSEIDVGLDVVHLSEDASRALLASNREEVERMARMVDNLLTLASIQDGRLDLLLTPTKLRDLVRGVVESLDQLAKAAGIRVRTDGRAVSVVADPERLKQVVANLVENAVKYSEPGTEVRVATWERSDEVGFTVSDTGPGIPAEALPRLFDRFFRIDAARSSGPRGSGLGLAICSDIVKAHQGRIWVESREGDGSSFSVALPAG